MTRRLAPAALLLAALALAGCGDGKFDGAAASKPPSPSASPSGRAANEVECVNIERAYNAWKTPSMATTAADIADLNEVTMRSAMDHGKNFADAVTGYNDQPSKALAVKIAEYNVELAAANAELVITDSISADQASKVEAALAAVDAAYQEFAKATCA